jgi:hypothetical protein
MDGTYWTCSQAVSKPVWHIPLPCVQWKTPHDGQGNCPKHVEFHVKNKFKKSVHLVGSIIRNNVPHLQIHMAAVLFIFKIFILSDTLMFHYGRVPVNKSRCISLGTQTILYTINCHSPLAWILSHVQYNATTIPLYTGTNSNVLLTFAVCCLSPLPWILSYTQRNTSHSVSNGSSSSQGHDMMLPTQLYPLARLSTCSAVTQWPYISSRNAWRQILYLLLMKCYFNSTSASSPPNGQYYAEDTMATVVQTCIKRDARTRTRTCTHTHTLLTFPNFCVVLCIFVLFYVLFVLFYVFLCCSMYFLCSMYFCVVLCIFVLFYVFFCCSMYFLCCSMYFLCSMYCLSCVILCIVCMYMCTVLLPPGGYPIAVNKYVISNTTSIHSRSHTVNQCSFYRTSFALKFMLRNK